MKNIIYNLVDRAILLSHKKFHKDNFRKIQKMLLNNNYPWDFIQKNTQYRKNSLKYKRIKKNQDNFKVLPKIQLPDIKNNYKKIIGNFETIQYYFHPISEKES